MTLPDRRLTSNWLEAYLEYNEKHEAVEAIHRWVGIALISAIIRRKVYIELELGSIRRVYPNVYVILVAESARARKSAAMDTGRDLLIDAVPDMKIMRDSMTSQGLIKALNHNVTAIRGNKIVEELRSDVAIFADEVANLFSYDKLRAAQMTIFLTRCYECPSIYDHTTARDSTVRLYNTYPMLLGGTDPRNLKTIPEEAAGGLTGRIMWVIESQRRANNSGWKRNTRYTLKQQLLREYLIHDLQRIGKLEGEMLVKPEAQEIYDIWYGKLSEQEYNDPATDAFYQRCHTTALRICEVLSIASHDELVATPQHMIDAITLIESQLPTVKRILTLGGGSHFEQNRAKLIAFLGKSKAGIAYRGAVLNHMGIVADDFERLLQTLLQDGTIELPKLAVNGQKVIKLKEGVRP